jgi:hypothetical protein
MADKAEMADLAYYTDLDYIVGFGSDYTEVARMGSIVDN